MYTAVEVWDLVADTYPVSLSVRRRAVGTPIQSGLVVRRQTFSSESVQGQAAVRTFVFNFKNATKADFNRAVALWKNTTGGTQGMSFTHSDTAYASAEVIIVRMVAAPLVLQKMSHGNYAFRVTLEEMLDSP